MNELYTSSRLKVLRSCLRLHFYRYALGIVQPSSAAAEFGTVCHAALEAWYRAWQAGALGARLSGALLAIGESALSAYDKAKALALVTAYHLRWSDKPWRVIGVEIEFRYELGGYLIGGKIDALIEDMTDGRIWVVEHKTTSLDASPGSAYWSRLSIDTQVSIYIDGATVLGHEVAGCIYDVLQRPRHEPKLATPEAERKYTIGKGCKICGGDLQGKKGAGVVGDAWCSVCSGTGWRFKDGKPEAPHLYASQRDADEALADFSDRLVDEIGDEPDLYLIRGEVVRLDDELPRMRDDLLDAIKLERAASLFDVHPRNPDACARFGTLCPMFDACSGSASIDDTHRFPRGTAHPELAAAI